MIADFDLGIPELDSAWQATSLIRRIETMVPGLLTAFRRRRIRKLVRGLGHPAGSIQARAVASLRRLVLLGRTSIAADVLRGLEPALHDNRDWVRWNAVNVLMDLGPRQGRAVPTRVRAAFVGTDGQVKLDTTWEPGYRGGLREPP